MPVLYLDPDGDGVVDNWGGTYTSVDEGVRYPSAGFTGSISTSNTYVDIEFTVPDIAVSGTATSVELWYSFSNEPCDGANLKWNGAWKTAVSPSVFVSGVWYKHTWTITDSLASITDNGIRLTSGDFGDDTGVYSTYLKVSYTETAAAGNPWYHHAQQGGM